MSDETRYSINWSVLDRRIGTLGITPASLSRAIGRSDGFYSAMKNNNSRMLRKDALRIANVLNIHGVTKFTAETKQTVIDVSNEPIISKIEAHKNRETEPEVMTRIADALERIATALEGRKDPWQLSL